MKKLVTLAIALSGVFALAANAAPFNTTNSAGISFEKVAADSSTPPGAPPAMQQGESANQDLAQAQNTQDADASADQGPQQADNSDYDSSSDDVNNSNDNDGDDTN